MRRVAGAMTPTGLQVCHLTLVSVVKHQMVAALLISLVLYGLRQKLLLAKPDRYSLTGMDLIDSDSDHIWAETVERA